MPDVQALLARFHHALVVEIRKSRPDYLHAPFTVAEIYQNLVPYRSHRDVIGVEMNGDYEDALLRLLAGEGDYLTLESEVARREIRDELKTNNPNTGLFRDFAAADVTLNPEKIDSEAPPPLEKADEAPWAAAEHEHEVDADDSDEAAAGFAAATDEALEPTTFAEAEDAEESPPEDDFQSALAHYDDVATPEMDVVEPAAQPEGETAYSDESRDEEDSAALDQEEAPSDEACPWCRADLPERPGMKFCPFCGSSLELAPCGECGEEIEPSWRFCIKCGTEIRS